MTTPDLPPPTLDELSKMLSRAFSLGQTYWQQADSESYSQNRKSDATLEKFRAMQDGFLPAIVAYGDARAAEGEDMTMTQAATDVLAERQRQIKVENWTPEHDDTEHDDGNLACAGAAYALAAGDALGPYSQGDAGFTDEPPDFWPENWHWKPSNPRRMLVKAAALLLAEIERLDRAKEQQP